MSPAHFLKVESLGHAFGGREVFRDFHFTAGAGEFIALLGPSGCGKSTLLRILAGLEQATAGRITFPGDRPRLSFVFQDPTLLAWKNLQDNVLLPLSLEAHGDPLTAKTRAHALLERVKLTGFESHFPAQLSGGMKMRASLARALISDPQLFLLDEPFASLDEETREGLDFELRSLFEERARAGTRPLNIFFVTHSVSEAVLLADRILVFSRGSPSGLRADLISPLAARPRTPELRYDPDFVAFARQVQALARDPGPQGVTP